jgi:hypothetical protein
MKSRIPLAVMAGTVLILLTVTSCRDTDKETGSGFSFSPPTESTRMIDVAWEMEQQMMGRKDLINLDARYAIEVTGESGSGTKMTVTYDRFRLYMKIMEFELDINTEEPPSGDRSNDPSAVMSDVFRKIKGKSFTMEVDRKGNIVAVNGFDKIVESIIDSARVDADMKLQLKASLADQFNEQEWRNQVIHFFAIFPNSPVKAGDTWKNQYSVGTRLPADFATTFQAKQATEKEVSIDANSIITPNNEDTKVSGQQTGSLVVDKATGWVLEANFEQEVQATTGDLEMTVTRKGHVSGKRK